MTINAERKHFGLRPSRKERLRECISSVVRLDIPGTKPECLIICSDTFIKHIGKELPRGVSKEDPAYLSVTFAAGVYTVWARYVSGGPFVELWRTATRPAWIPKEKSNANHPSPPTGATRRTAGVAPAAGS